MEMQLAGDRRSDRRSVEVVCHVVRVPGLEVLSERVIELSTHGMLVLSDVPCAIGDTVLVTFDVPGTEGERSITTSARVARIVEGRRFDDPGRAVGIAFEGLDSASERILRGALEGLPEAAAKRPSRVDYAATATLIALGE